MIVESKWRPWSPTVLPTFLQGETLHDKELGQWVGWVGGGLRYVRDGSVVKNPSANTGNSALIPGPGGSHMLWGN